MSGIDRLFVIWGEPIKGSRHVIGRLERAGGEFRFWYEADLERAVAHGFRLLPEFPDRRGADAPYVERYLFALFAERIPTSTRSDASGMLRAWGVERPDDQFEVLAKSGGIRATDRLEVAEYRAVDDDLERPLEFRIAGHGRIVDPAPLALDTTVTLRPEPDNEADASAVVVDSDGKRAGYVPRQYTALVGSFLERGAALEGKVVRKLLVPDDVGKWVVRISRRR